MVIDPAQGGKGDFRGKLRTGRAVELLVPFVIFVIAAASVWFAGYQLALLSDEIADRYNLARSLIGLVFLSVATSLPEIATTLTAAAQSNAALVTNNLLGGIALQTAVLAVADFWARGALTNYPRKPNHALEAVLLILLLAAVQSAIVVNEPFAVLGVGVGSFILGLVYVFAIMLLRRYASQSDWVPVDLPSELGENDTVGPRLGHSKHLFLKISLYTAVILVLGVILVITAENLADLTGLGNSFIGVTVLAAATSLPELSATVSAVRIGAYTLAISNIFGSNLIMIVLLLPADMLYRPGPLLREADLTAQLAITSGILLTGIYLTGLIVRRKPSFLGIGVDSAMVLVGYAISVWLFYFLR